MKMLLVDDHSVVRAGLRGLLGVDSALDIHEAATGEAALAMAPALRPDLIILDLNLPGIGGLELLRRLLQLCPASHVLVLSMHTEPSYAIRAIEAGARGYVSKNAPPDELRLAIGKVMDGQRYIEAEIAQEVALLTAGSGELQLRRLTDREFEILRLLSSGRSMTEIAAALAISYKTVANTCTHMKTKLGVTRTVDLIRLALSGADQRPGNAARLDRLHRLDL